MTRSAFRRILVRLNEAECTQKSPLLCGIEGFFEISTYRLCLGALLVSI